MALTELDRVEILSLQDNSIDITAMDDSDVDGTETWDAIEEEDSSIAMLPGSRGLIVLSGCARTGIVKTARRAMAVTGDIFSPGSPLSRSSRTPRRK